MRDSFHLNTQIVGLIGHPIKHTFSPFIHNVGFEIKKLDYIYLPFDIPPANLKNGIKGIVALNTAQRENYGIYEQYIGRSFDCWFH